MPPTVPIMLALEQLLLMARIMSVLAPSPLTAPIT
ncbi:hypothetical protein GGI52_004480 [Pseudomonas moraviensis]|uniref:Uncharacterized protein n=1 Tax=Pseudomonas moraviensis TaxID=321662 RepID=A0A7Z0AWP0_9PSED|nr:hypothetical protein [Pseudomonas moraviensis]